MLGLEYASVLVPGIPAYLFLRRLEVRKIYGYVLAGFFVAVAVTFIGEIVFAFADSGTTLTFANVVQMLRLPVTEPRGTQMFVAPAAVYGPLTALVFWLIARPDLAEH